MFTLRSGGGNYPIGDVELLLRLAYYTMLDPDDPHALTPQELRDWTAEETWYGYPMSDVDAYVDDLIVQLEARRA